MQGVFNLASGGFNVCPFNPGHRNPGSWTGGVGDGREMSHSHEPSPQRQVYRGTRLTVQTAVHLKKLSTGWGTGPA